jgi:hypothetical protein
MSLKCRIYKDENGNIDFVEAANGKRSKLFDTLVNITGGNKNTALNLYAITEVEDFKDITKAKVNSVKNRLKTLVKAAPETANELSTERGIKFSRLASNNTYFSNAISAVNNLTDRNPKNTQGWLKQLTDTQKNGGVKNVNQELEWIGLGDYLNNYAKENNTKAGNIPAFVVEDYIKSNQIEIVDVSKGKPEIDINDLEAEFDGNGFNIRYSGEGNLIMPYITLDQIGLTEEDTYEEDFDYYSAQEDAKKAAKEEVLDREDGEVKYSGYKLKGGENYREVLLTMPVKRTDITEAQRVLEEASLGNLDYYGEVVANAQRTIEQSNLENQSQYKSSHWDEGNILAHIRLNEKVLQNGDKVLIVNEIQSDWAQEGRKKGFIENTERISKEDYEKEEAAISEEAKKILGSPIANVFDLERVGTQEALDLVRRVEENTRQFLYLEGVSETDMQKNMVKQMPYKKTDQWVGLATRRILQMAAQEGYNGVAFINGQQASSMYSLSSQVDEITAIQNMADGENIGTYSIYGLKDGTTVFSQYEIPENELESYVGRELAKSIIEENLNNPYNPKTSFEGVELEVGGEGMKSFYDNIVPKVAQKEAQRFDKNAKLGIVDFIGELISTNYRFQDVKDVSFNGKSFQRYIRYQGGLNYMTIRNLQMAIEEDMSELLLRNNFKTLEEAKKAANENDEDGIAVVRIFEQGIKDHDSLNGKDISDLDIEYFETAKLEKDKLSLAEQPYIKITDRMRSELKASIPMFSKSLSETSKNEILPQIISRLEVSGLANNVYQMTNSQIENKLTELGVDAQVAKQVTISEGDVDYVSFNTDEEYWEVYLNDGSYLEVYSPEDSTEQEVKEDAVSLIREYQIESLPAVYRGINGDFSPNYKGTQYFAVQKRYAGVFGRNIEEFKIKSPDILDLSDWNTKWQTENFFGGQGLLTIGSYMLNDLKKWERDIYFDLVKKGFSKEEATLESADFIKEVENAKIIKGEDIGNKGQVVFAVKDKTLVEPINRDINFSKQLSEKNIKLNTAGFTYRGDVYLNTDVMGLDTPIHEFGHLHLDWLKENRNDLYQAGVSLVGKNKEEAQQYIDIVKNTQPDLDEGTEEFNNEVLAQVIGDQGAKLILNNKKGSISEWLKSVWNAIKEAVGLSNYTAEQVSAMTLSEFGVASAADILNNRFEGSRDFSDSQNIMYSVLSDYRDNQRFKYSDLIYPDVVFKDIANKSETKVATNFYKKIVGKFNKTFDRDLKVISSETVNDFTVTVEYETGLRPKYFAYPTAVMGEHVTVDNIDKNVPLTSLRHELIHEMLVKNITDKFERINNLDNSANIVSVEEVQRNRAYNYTLEDVFFERVVENVERNPDNQDTFEVSTFGTDIINRVKKELEGIPMSKENVMGTLEELFEGSNPWLKTTVLDIFDNKVDYSVEDLSQLNDEVGKMFKQRFDLSRDIFTKELQYKIFEFASFFNEEYTGVLTRLNKIGKRNKLTRVVPGNTLFVDSLPAAVSIANSYMRDRGLPLSITEKITKLDINNSEKIAREFENLVDERGNVSSETKAAYKALAEETLAQYEKIVSYGYEMEINDTEPYSSSKEMIEDLRNNKRMKVFSTESGYGEKGITAKERKSDPRLAVTKFKDVNGYPLLVNDIFRFVHDFFGHAKLGNGFGAIGEENAWNIHSKMYSPLAKRAMTTETRGQNSWVNFSGVNDDAFALRDKARILRKEGNLEEANALTSQVYDMMKFADQKIGLMPLWVSQSEYKTAEDKKVIELNGSKVYFKNQVNPINGEVTGKIEMELVETPQELRGAGRAREAFKAALKYTDSIGKDTVLTISSRDPYTTEAGLEKFYTSLGYQKTSDFEMERSAEEVLPKGYDENGEPSIKDLMEYANSSNEVLLLEDRIISRNAAIALGVKSSEELISKLEKAFVKDGVFMFDKVSLQRNGAFNKYEATKIVNSITLQKNIKNAYLQLKNTEPFVLEYDENFVTVSGSELNIFGKQPVGNPFTVELELAKDIAGLTEESVSDNLVPELGTKYTKDAKFKEAVNNIAKNNRLVSIKVVKDGQLVDKVEDVRDTLENVLIDTDNEALSENIRFINENISAEVWEENLNLVIKVLASIKKNAIKNGIDLRDITTKALSSSREDILDFLDTMENLFQYGMDEQTVGEFSEAYKTIFELDTIETDLIQTDSKFDNIVESNISEYQLFDKFGLVKKQGDIYRQTEEQSLEDLYGAMFENSELFPETIKTVDELKQFVEKEVSNLEISDYEIDPDNLAKIYLYKKYFGFSLVAPVTKVSVDSLSIVTEDPAYLVTEFVKEFNKWILDTKNNYFKVTNKGIELVEKDPLSKEEALLTIPEEYIKDLSEYDAISKNLNLGIRSEELVFEDYDSQSQQREFFANNPESAKKISGDYLYIEDGVLAVKNETDTFIRTPQGVFEMIYEAGNIKFYNKLPEVDPNFKFVGLEKPLSDVDFNKYQYLENTPEVFKTAKTYYSKKELDQIDEDYFNCQ